MKITVLHEGLEVDLELHPGDTPRDVIGRMLRSPDDGELPEGVELRREGVALELGRPLDADVSEGTVLTLHLRF
jgi:hypothetical protein